MTDASARRPANWPLAVGWALLGLAVGIPLGLAIDPLVGRDVARATQRLFAITGLTGGILAAHGTPVRRALLEGAGAGVLAALAGYCVTRFW